MKIVELFRRDIARDIPEVIHVDAVNRVAEEIDEYVATRHIKEQLEEVLENYQETILKPTEDTNVWVSGFFGSGKSSFAKMLGYLAENPSIEGRTALERFKERVDAPRIEALLNVAHAQAAAFSVFLDMSTSRNVAREGESIVLPLYRALLERFGYSRNLLLAELEYDLETDGDLAAFQKAFAQVSKGNRAWIERRDVGFAKSEASHALHILRPDKYPDVDSWAKQAESVEVTANWFAERALSLLERRGDGRKRLVFIVDEVGQYVARSISRMLDLQGLAEAMQKRRGSLWLVVTSQERLEDVLDSLEGKRVELARVQDRFPISADLLPGDIKEVTSRRVLEKTSTGREELRFLFTKNRNKLLAHTRLESATRSDTPSEDDVLSLYPLVPYQVQVLIDAISARRAHGGASPILGGSNRTIIKLAQVLVTDPKAGLGEHPMGDLVTIDRAYDQLESVIPTAWQSEVEQVTSKYGQDSIEAQVIKSVALCSDVGALSLTAENIAVLLHPAITAESVLSEVREALDHLVVDDRIRLGDDGYQLQSAEQKDWEKARRQIDLRPAEATRIRRLIVKEGLAGLTVTRGRVFKVEVTVEGEKLTDGDIALHIEEADAGRRSDLRSLSREAAAKTRLTWAFEESPDTYEAILELHRSRSMIERRDTPSKTVAEVELLGEERVRQTRWERLVAERLARDLTGGQIIFRGTSEDAPAAALRSAAQQAVSRHIDDIYERIDQFSANVTGRDVLAVLHADNLDGISPQLREDGIGVTHSTSQGEQVVTDRDPLLALLTEIRDRAAYGNEATGRHLETLFSGPPYGAPVEVIQAILAAGIRAGLVDVIHQGSRIRGSADQRLDRVFGALPQFRAASFVPPVDDEVSLEVRVDLAERLGQLIGTRPPVATDQLAALVRSTFVSDTQIASRVTAGLRGLGLKVPEPVTRASAVLERLDDASDAEVVTTTVQSWVDLAAGREALVALDTVVQQDLETLRSAQSAARAGDEGLASDLATERLELVDLLGAEDLPAHIARIRAITERLVVARLSAIESANAELKVKVAEKSRQIRVQYADVNAAVLDEALRPLEELVPTGSAVEHALGQLLAKAEAVDTRAIKVARQLDEIVAKGKVAHLVIHDLVTKPLTTEDELDTALERVRDAAAAELANGKQVRFT
ncbi:BREX system P-loop protein BrxC [[Mycobacterium] burgundiense]|uniref:BREX system P-loop protein BrxC n=1 Tax=[Mycobacterium] burgundiense TaxID=3064286 RepID=A0ABM9LLZ8_9MYCO|nr:BREX system P-loop protein BrxC [Mycolicibacterium sp. MU0053]CAJ1501191.1 BREX system P-loop protein BrxC [Mycolicibacterium sp. MU0053]